MDREADLEEHGTRGASAPSAGGGGEWGVLPPASTSGREALGWRDRTSPKVPRPGSSIPTTATSAGGASRPDSESHFKVKVPPGWVVTPFTSGAIEGQGVGGCGFGTEKGSGAAVASGLQPWAGPPRGELLRPPEVAVLPAPRLPGRLWPGRRELGQACPARGS